MCATCNMGKSQMHYAKQKKKTKKTLKATYYIILFICHPGKGNIMGIKVQSVVVKV